MTHDLSPFQQDLVLVLWWAMWTSICLIVVLVAWSGISHAVSLSITGHSAGTGMHLLNFSGEQLNVTIYKNNDSANWTVFAGGVM